MTTFTQLTDDGFPLYLAGNRHTPHTVNRLLGDSLIDAIERGMSAMLAEKQVGNAAGYRIISATTKYEENLFPPASTSIQWGNLTNADRQCGGGFVTTVETSGFPLAHTGSTEPRKVVRLYFAGTADDVPVGEFHHEMRPSKVA